MGVMLRRRQADLERLRELAAANPGKVEIVATEGEPPSMIRFRLNCQSITDLPASGPPVIGGRHLLRVHFGQRYPLEPPLVYVESPIANPHVFPTTRRICIGAAWIPSETLDLFVQRVWAILAWDPQVIDPDSPANPVALRWSEEHRDRLPIEPARLRNAGAAVETTSQPRLSWRG